jgi:hypothetical protein
MIHIGAEVNVDPGILKHLPVPERPDIGHVLRFSAILIPWIVQPKGKVLS